MNVETATLDATGAPRVIRIKLTDIDRSNRLRPVDPALAQAIAESMRERGQMTPVLVQAREGATYRLIAGDHRCQARVINGDDDVLAIVHTVSGTEAELMEIDENLARADLNELDRAVFMGERKRLYEQLYPQTKHGKASKKDKVAGVATILRFTLDAANRTKMAERTIQRLVHRYENIEPTVRERLKGSWIATEGAVLDEIGREPREHQMAIVAAMLREHDPQPTVRAAKVEVFGIPQKPKDDVTQKHFSGLMAAWRKYNDRRARQQFREFLADSKSSRE